jgi:hypothetical protein
LPTPDFPAPSSAFAGLWAVPYLTQMHAMSRAVASNHVSIYFLGFAVGSALWGRVSDAVGRRKAVALAVSGVHVLGWFDLAVGDVAGRRSLPLAATYGLCVMMGLATAGFTLSWASAKEVNPPQLSGMATSVVNVGIFLGPAILQPSGGLAHGAHLGWHNGCRRAHLLGRRLAQRHDAIDGGGGCRLDSYPVRQGNRLPQHLDCEGKEVKAILLYGHGARNPEWAQPFHRIRAAIKARDPRALVEPGFLELMRPTFDEGVACLVDQGATTIMVVPIFMAAGSHVKKDLPRLAADAMDRHAGLRSSNWPRRWARPTRCWRRWPTMRWARSRRTEESLIAARPQELLRHRFVVPCRREARRRVRPSRPSGSAGLR